MTWPGPLAKIEPFADGDSYELWLAQSVSRQEYERPAKPQKDWPLKTSRDNYGIKGIQSYRNNAARI